MDTDVPGSAPAAAAAAAAAAGAAAPAPPAVKEDVGPYSLENPLRVVPAQARLISIKPECR